MSLEKKLCKYVLPQILAMVGMSCYVFADTFFISVAEGANGITALNLALPIYSLLFAIGAMLGTGFATRYTLLKENGDSESERFFSHSVEWGILIGLIFTVFGVIFTEAILRIMGANDEILAVGTPYLRTVLSFAPFFMLNYTLTAFVRNDYAPKLAMAATLSSSIFNIIFDYIFIFPMGMGMTGAALATGISPIVSCLICLIHFCSKSNVLTFHLTLPSPKLLIKSCPLGIAAFISEIANGITTAAFNFILLDLVGNIGVAAYGIVANIAIIAIAIFNGIAQGQQPLLSELQAKSNKRGELRVLRSSLIIGLGIALILTIVICVFAPWCASLFNSEGSEALSEYAIPGLRIYFIGLIFAAANLIRAGYFAAIGHASESFVISISRGIVFIIIFAFILSRFLGITGVWLSFPVAELFTLLVTMPFHRRQRTHASVISNS